MPGASSSWLATTVIAISFGFALVMALLMLFLLIRRWSSERHAVVENARSIALSRELMAAQHVENAPLFRAVRPTEQLRAITRMLQLLRGEDHKRVLNLAREAHVYDRALSGLTQTEPARRVDAMRILEHFPTSDSIDALCACMGSDPVMAVRLEAAAALARAGALPKPATIIHMLDLAHQPLTRLHGALFRSVAVRDMATIADLAEDVRYSRMRALLVEALGWSEDYMILPKLEQHAIDDDPEVRCAALKAARHLGHPGTRRWIVSRLVDPAEAVRIQAIRTCGALDIGETIPILFALATSSSWWVRMRAAEALDRLRPEQSASTLTAGVAQ